MKARKNGEKAGCQWAKEAELETYWQCASKAA